MSLRCDSRARTLVMGILNVTPDSFSDGGRFIGRSGAVRRALSMVRDGADIIDIGGESTRPGAKAVTLKEELSRVIPVVRAVADKACARISIDTRKAPVAEEAIRAGATIVNDVSGLTHDGRMAKVVARHGVWLIIMHMRGSPGDMQSSPRYKDVVKDIIRDLRSSMRIATAAGVSKEKIIIDPGIGFGKTFEHNLEILRRLDEFKALGRPVCIGTSRKSFIGRALGVADTGQRLMGSIATCVIAIDRGAGIVRAHDVKETAQAVRMTDFVLKGDVS